MYYTLPDTLNGRHNCNWLREKERARGRYRFSRGLLLVLVRKFRTMGRKCVAIKIIQFLALFVFNLLHRQSQLCDELMRTSITR